MIKETKKHTYKLINSITGQIVKVVSISAGEDMQKDLDSIRLKVAVSICQPYRFLHWIDPSNHAPQND